MNKIRLDHQLNPIEMRILEEVTRIAKENSIDCIVVGAMARDILLTHLYGMPVQRATADVDFAVAVQNWEEFEMLKNILLQVPKFHPSPQHVYRLHYKHDTESESIGYPFDLVPYGGVEDQHGQIHWPPDMDIMMNVSAYSEVLSAADEIQISDGLTVKVASLPGLTVLKLFAWVDRGSTTAKDALDLRFIWENYAEAGNYPRIYDQHYDLLEGLNHDLTLAGIWLLAGDVRNLVSGSMVEHMLKLLQDEGRKDKLIQNMLGQNRDAGAFEKMENMIEQFINGLKG
jgi:predicted nucleotidyltransferase